MDDRTPIFRCLDCGRSFGFESPSPDPPRPCPACGGTMEVSVAFSSGSDRPAGSTSALVGLLARILAWELTAAMFLGRLLFGPGWFGPAREWGALGLSLALTAYYLLRGRPALRRAAPAGVGPGQHLSPGQSAVVVVAVIAAGGFGAWLFIR